MRKYSRFHCCCLFLLMLLWGNLTVGVPTAFGQDEGAKPKAEASEQPLQQIIERVLGLHKREDSTPPDQEPELRRDMIDQRAPLLREQEALLRSAVTRIERKQWSEALEILQAILNESTESVVVADDGQFHSIRWETQRQIQSLPAEARQMYERIYGPLAQRLLEEATGRSDYNTIRETAERYFHTPAGYAAANLIAAHHLDKGEFAIASRWYRRLAETPADFVNDPLWQFKVVETYQRAGYTAVDVQPWFKLTETQEQELSRRLPGRDSQATRAEWNSISPLMQRPLKDWLFPGGSKNRAGHAQGSAPLLLSHWSHQLVEHPEVRDLVSQLLDDLRINQLPAIPVMQPLVIGNRVVFRTFEGLRVVDAETGEMHWETRDDVSPMQVLTGQSQPQFRFRQHMIGQGNYQTSQADQNPVTSLLFRDGVHGTFSSDGQRVYLIEQNAILSNNLPGNYYNNFNPTQNDPFRRDWSSNRLTAYDLATGQQVWHAGGRLMNEPIDPPLAGTYFFGPPLCDGGDLFLIGEQDNSLTLFCLEAATGQVRWSLLLAFSDTPIDRDMARRWWPAAVSLSEGILVCPTNVGFLVGVDRHSQEILWISRYRSRNPEESENTPRHSRANMVMTPAGTLKDRWFTTPPMIVGQTVIHAPSEEPKLLAYRLADGKQLWQLDNMKESLYPLGSYQDELIVVAGQALTGYETATGKIRWSVRYSEFDPEFSEQGATPSGRGLIMGDQVLLPVNERELWYFDLKTRQFVSRARVPDESSSLGNLVMAQGKLVVAGPLTVDFFQPKLEIEDEIQQRLAADPRDTWGLMKQAQVLALEQQFEAAMAALQQVPQPIPGEVQGAQWRRQFMDATVGLVKNQPHRYDAEFQQLESLLTTDEDRQHYLRLLADRMMARKDLAAAFSAYAQLAQFDSQSLIRDTNDASLTVRQDVWLQNRLRELWQVSSGTVSGKISDSVRQAIKSAIRSGELQQMLEVAHLYGFHPEIEELYLAMIDEAAEQQNFAIANFTLSNMEQFEDESVQATAVARRAELLLQLGLTEDAIHYAEKIQPFEQGLVMLEGLTVAEWREEFYEKNELQQTDQRFQPAAWSGEKYEVVPIGTSSWHHQVSSLNLGEHEAPYFRQHRLLFDQRFGRLEIFNRENDQLVWSIPLQQLDTVSQTQVLPVRIDGHLLTTYYRGIVQCYSLPDQRLVWSQVISNQPGVINQIQTGKTRLPRLQQAKQAASRFRLNQFTNEFGPLIASTPHVTCYLGRNELVAVDACSGQVRWTRRGIQRGTCVYGDAEVLCIVPPNTKEAYLVRTSDGQKLEATELESLINRGIAVHGHNVIGVQEPNTTSYLGTAEGNILLVSENLLTREVEWELPVDNSDHLSLLDSQTLLLVGKTGSLQLVNLADGQILTTGQIDPAIIRGQKEMFAFLNGEQLFLIANHNNMNSSFMSIYNQRVNGYITALDRRTGEELWSKKVPALNLVLDDLTQMPVFILGGTKNERRHNLYLARFSVLILDKQTGAALLEESFAAQNQIQQITWNAARRQIKMHAYNSVYTIQPAGAKLSPEKENREN